MKTDIINYSQEYIDSHYMEFSIPSKDNEVKKIILRKTKINFHMIKFAMESNYLHIWPRHDFMLIGLPNQDKSFTTTLFLPLTIFQQITTPDELLRFFQKYFPDAILLIGRENLIETFFSSKPLPLVSIKCSPHTSACGDILLMGDAAHSMVPFYAQGMNSAFEDTVVLFEKLKENNFQFPKAFKDYK
jgi:2-polyprenyl-6-methoxyphenol hydroxylase-like FAD-dependent oxidoreductase